MHLAANSLATTTLGSGSSTSSHTGELGVLPPGVGTQGAYGQAVILFEADASLYFRAPAVLWYESSAIDVDIEWDDIEIEVTPNIGVTTE